MVPGKRQWEEMQEHNTCGPCPWNRQACCVTLAKSPSLSRPFSSCQVEVTQLRACSEHAQGD